MDFRTLAISESARSSADMIRLWIEALIVAPFRNRWHAERGSFFR